MDADDILLNDVWSLYFHDPYDTDWTCSSYKRICNISSVKEFWRVHDLLKSNIHSGMFFLMREHVFPCWDDSNNIDGGCLSIKVLKQHMWSFWEEMCIRMLGETMSKDVKFWDNVNGISTSPKRNFCIVKVWLKSSSKTNAQEFNIPTAYHGDIFFKLNRDNMEMNNNVVPVPSNHHGHHHGHHNHHHHGHHHRRGTNIESR